jgi:nucleoside-diphosphate-sugar epimerase
MTRRESELPAIQSKGAHGIIGDLLDPHAFLDKLPPQDAVVSIAMPLEFGRMSSKKFREVTERTTIFASSALAVGKKLDCPLILSLGTSYRTEPGEVADETWPIERFGLTKAGDKAERLIREAVHDGQPIIQMIPGQIYGAGGQFLEMYRMLKSGRFGVVGKGNNRIPRVHVEDCAEVFALAVDKLPIGESFIVADDTPCTAREFTEFMAECANMSRPRTIPKLLARLILGKLLVETMEMDCVVSNEKAKRVLGWELKYPSYREGLDAAIKEIESIALLDS